MLTTPSTPALDDSVEKILVQFSVGKRRRFSNWVPLEKAETKTDSDDRKTSFVPGVVLMEPIPNVSIATLIAQLRAFGWSLVDAVEQERVNRNQPGRTYYAARFVFAKERFNMKPDWEQILDEKILPELERLAGECCWRARAFRNALQKAGEVIEGKHALSFNFEAPSPPDMKQDKVKGELIVRSDGLFLARPRAETAN